MPDLTRLQVFLTVAREGSFSAAARKLGITQPAVSVHIAALEEETGAQLCERLSRGVVLTEAGAAVQRGAEAILERWGELQEEIAALENVPRGPLLVAASTVPGEYILPRLVPRFRWDNPLVRVTVTVTDSGGVMHMLLAGEAELGLTGVAPGDPRLAGEPFAQDELVLAAPPGHPVWAAGPIQVQVLYEQPLVAREPSSGTRAVLEQALERAGGDPGRLQVVAELGSPQAVKTAVLGGLGVAVLSVWTVRDEVEQGRLRAEKIAGLDLQRPLFVVFPRHRSMRLAARRLYALLREGGEASVGTTATHADDQGCGVSG